MVSQTVEYALRAIVTIAQRGGTPVTSKDVAEITQVPGPYLSKLMQSLVKSGIVTSQRGLHGGFLLVKSPQELTLLDIVNAIEPLERILSCPLKIASHSGTLCPLHRALDDMLATNERMLKEKTVASVMAQPGSVSPLCDANEPPIMHQLGLP